MTSPKHRFIDQTLELLWSLWTEMGISGAAPANHTNIAVDPEPLIILTAGLEDTDPRLRDEATDWCVRYGNYVSGSRLRNLLKQSNKRTRLAFGEFSATVNAHSNLRWWGATTHRRYKPTGRSMIQDFTKASMITLRLRALFGVSARAEVIRAYVSDPSAEYCASDLARDVGFTKRSVSSALDALHRSGILENVPVRNLLHYRLKNSSRLESFVGKLPDRFPKWPPTMRVISGIHEILSTYEKLEEMARAVETKKAYDRLIADIALARIPFPTFVGGDFFLAGFEEWSVNLVTDLAAGRPALPKLQPSLGSRP